MPEGPDDCREKGQDDQKQDSHVEIVVVDADCKPGNQASFTMGSTDLSNHIDYLL